VFVCAWVTAWVLGFFLSLLFFFVLLVCRIGE